VSFIIFNTLNTLGNLGNIRYLLIFVCFIDVFFIKNKIRKVKDTLLISSVFCFLLYILFNTLFISNIFDHSLSQYLQFIVLIIFTFIGTNFKNLNEFKYIYDNIFNLYTIILILSVFSLVIPSISFARNGSGFQGVTLHPNAYGVYFSSYTALNLILFIFNKKKINLLLFVLSFVFLLLSQSRTSIFSVLLGIGVYFLITPEFRKKFSHVFIIAFPIIILFFLAFNKNIMDFVYKFLLKSSSSGNIRESFESSRGSIVKAQLNNIDENKLFGIGFKVPSNKTLQMVVDTDIIKYEKGNLLLASIEELGIIGFLFFIILIILLTTAKNTYNTTFKIIPIVLVFTTLGESTLFSIGGLGAYIWAMLFLNKKSNYSI